MLTSVDADCAAAPEVPVGDGNFKAYNDDDAAPQQAIQARGTEVWSGSAGDTSGIILRMPCVPLSLASSTKTSLTMFDLALL